MKPFKLSLILPFLLPIILILLPLPIQKSISEFCTPSFILHRRHSEPIPEEQLQETVSWSEEQEALKALSLAEMESFCKDKHILFAPVVMRSETSWNSFLWIYPQEEELALMQINCPVVSGRALIGIIDYKGKKNCRVRLITDPDLHVAVRAVRGDNSYSNQIESIQALIEAKPDLLEKPEHGKALDKLLTLLKTKTAGEKPLHLAKGEISGLTQNSEGHPLLRGEGFQYDFGDLHGASSDLRSSKTALILPHDLLVTSGLDGIFPEGLAVGEVDTVFPLMEGATSYQILIRPALDPRSSPKWVAVLPKNCMQEENEPQQEDFYSQIIQEEGIQ